MQMTSQLYNASRPPQNRHQPLPGPWPPPKRLHTTMILCGNYNPFQSRVISTSLDQRHHNNLKE